MYAQMASAGSDVSPCAVQVGMMNMQNRQQQQQQQQPGFNQQNAWGQDPSTQAQHHKFRTKPCRYFNMPTGCKNGESCTFLHTIVPPDYVWEERPRRMNTNGFYSQGGGH